MPAFLAPVIAALMAAFSRVMGTRLGQWIVTALGAVGLQLVVGNTVMDQVMNMVRSSAGGIPGDLAAWLGVLNIDRYITIVLSAFVAGGIKRAILAKRGG